MPDSTTALADPWQVVRAINRAWVEGRPQDAAPHLHESVVFVAPGMAAAAPGRDGVIASYREFTDAAQVHAYGETEEAVHIAGATAVVTYRWTIDYTVGGERLRETGHDLFVLSRDGEAWSVVWRTLLPDAPAG